jgi:hypothetical protein
MAPCLLEKLALVKHLMSSTAWLVSLGNRHAILLIAILRHSVAEILLRSLLSKLCTLFLLIVVHSHLFCRAPIIYEDMEISHSLTLSRYGLMRLCNLRLHLGFGL